MGVLQVHIPGTLTDLNKYIDAERANKFAGAKIKEENTQTVRMACHPLFVVRRKVEAYPLDVRIHWFCRDARIDPDNIAAAKKFIMDGLVAAEIIVNDGWKQIRSFEDRFSIDRNFPRVVVSLHWD